MKRKKFITIGIITFIAVVLCIVIFVFLQWRASLDITRSQVKYDNGDIVYIPDEDALTFDEEECIIYYNNLLSVYLLSDLSDKELKALADRVDGKIVGDISGCINYVQIKVSDSSFEELNRKADILNQLEEVLYASYDAPMFMQPSAADNNPWSGDTSAPESGRGNENNPNGNDWWAEAIGAYTAWEYVDSHGNTIQPITIGIIDTGFDVDHSEFSGKVTELNQSLADDHGTHVAGIIAANNDTFGIRGIADQSRLLCAGGISNMSSTQIIEMTKQMLESNARVINNSWGSKVLSQTGYAQLLARKSEGVDVVGMYFIADKIGSYEEYIRYCEKYANRTATECILMMTQLLLNGQDDFLFVQASGNGYSQITDWNEGDPRYADENIGIDATYSPFYCAVNEELYNTIYSRLNSTVHEKWKKAGITYNVLDEHLLIVGAASQNMDSRRNYIMTAFSNYGKTVDICAPGQSIFSTVIDGYDTLDGTSMAAPMVSGAAALLWSIDSSLSAADVRKLLLESGTMAVGVGKDAGTEYPMLNIGESVKKLTGWNNATNIQEGLYIVPGTQNILYVEQDEDEITFTAWWFKLASIEETATLNGSDAQFICGEGNTGQTSGKLHFEDSKAILTLDDNRLPYLDEQTEYIWLRDSLWELSEEQLRQIGQELKVPADLNIEYTQDKAYYWEAGGRYATYIQIIYNDEVIAAATVDSFTGELIKDIWMYSKSSTETTSVTKSLSHQDKTDVWTWITGEEFVYKNWASGEPNHQGGYEHYGMYYGQFTDGTWNDGSGASGPFICEWE